MLDIGEWVSHQVWLKLAGIVCITWAALRVKQVFRKNRAKLPLDAQSMEIVGKVYTAAIFFIGLLLSLQILGLDILPLVTFSGIGAAAVAFASRDVIANFFGGLMIYATRPFSIGDLIEFPGKKIKGYVEEIGWYFSSVRDSEKRPIYIPNSIFSSDLLLNHSRITQRLIQEIIRIRSKEADRIEPIIHEIRKLLERNGKLDHTESGGVFLVSVSPWGFEIELKAYTRTKDYDEYMAIKEQILLEVQKIVYQNEKIQPLTTQSNQ